MLHSQQCSQATMLCVKNLVDHVVCLGLLWQNGQYLCVLQVSRDSVSARIASVNGLDVY